MHTVEVFTPLSIERILQKIPSNESKGIAWLEEHYPGIDFLVERETVLTTDKGYSVKSVFTFYDPEIAIHFKLALIQ